MFSKLASVAIALSTIVMGQAVDRMKYVKTIVKGEDPEEVMKDYPFSVVSFYNPSDPNSVKVDALLNSVNKKFYERMSDMKTELRTVGWFRVN